MANNTSETVGCDLGDKRSEICVLDAEGDARLRTSVRTTVHAMSAWFTRAPAHVVIEVGAHSRWVSALLKQLGHRVGPQNAPGPFGGPLDECEWKRGGAVFRPPVDATYEQKA
jgi:hypothetical protein